MFVAWIVPWMCSVPYQFSVTVKEPRKGSRTIVQHYYVRRKHSQSPLVGENSDTQLAMSTRRPFTAQNMEAAEASCRAVTMAEAL